MKKRLLNIVILSMLSLMLVSCATRKEVVQFKNDTRTMRQQLMAIRQQNKELRKMLIVLNKKLTSLQDESQRTKADLFSQIDNLKNKSNVIDSKLADNADRMAGLMQQVESVKTVRIPSDTTNADSSLESLFSDLDNSTEMDPREIYKTAYMDLSRGNYPLAAQGFKEYLRQFPESEFADNAQYWLGEVFYAQQDYPQAINNFHKVIKNYPQGEKVPGALLKIGFCYLNLGSETSGKNYLRKLAQEFPDSEEARLARTRLSSFK